MAAVWPRPFLLAGVVAILQGYSFAKFGARYPSAGGMLEYIAKGFGDGHFTGVTAWLVYLVNAIVTAMVAVSFGSYASAMFTGEDKAWAKVFAVLIVVLMTGVNIAGSTLVAGAQTVIVYIVLSILIIFSVVTLANLNPSLLAPSTYPPLKDIVAGVALTFFAFLGFGIITFTARDLARPSRQLPKAMYLALGIATVIYVAIALGVFGTLTVEKVIASGGTALAVAAEPALGRAGYWLMSVTALFATAGATNAGLYPTPGMCDHLVQMQAEFPAIMARRFGGRVSARPALPDGGGPLYGPRVQAGRHRLDRQRGRLADLHLDHRGSPSRPRRDRRQRRGPRARDHDGHGGLGVLHLHQSHPRARLNRDAARHPRAEHRTRLRVEGGPLRQARACPGGANMTTHADGQRAAGPRACQATGYSRSPEEVTGAFAVDPGSRAPAPHGRRNC